MTNRIWGAEDDYAVLGTVDTKCYYHAGERRLRRNLARGRSEDRTYKLYNGLGQKIAPVQFMASATTQRFARVTRDRQRR